MVLFSKLLVIVGGLVTLWSMQVDSGSLSPSRTRNGLSVRDQHRVEDLTSTVQASQWLGPLAPIALSPFFGITCLAGISQFGGEYLPANAFISSNPVLKNPAVFWTFLTLTLITSIPRFSKVSKPVAQAIDQLEMYAGIITILVIRFLPAFLEGGAHETGAEVVVQMGIFSFTADTLLGLAAIVNIVVINTVKFFFEVLVWIIPVPMVDAALEVANKSFCAGLMAIYAWSPTVATFINLALFGVSLMMFRWIYRRVRYMRTMLVDPIRALLFPRWGRPTTKQVVVFAKESGMGFASKSKLLLRSTESGWELMESRFFWPPKIVPISRTSYRLVMEEGMWINRFLLEGPETITLLFSRRHQNHLSRLAEMIGAEWRPEDSVVGERTVFE